MSNLKRLSKRSIRAVTLVELLIAITLTAVIASAIGVIFSAAMEAWRFGTETGSIEAVVPELINAMTEGDYVNAGLVDALEVTYADRRRVSFVPLYVDEFSLDSFSNPEQIFQLSRPFLAGAPLPRAQIRFTEKDEFRNVRSVFYGGSSAENEDKPRSGGRDEIQLLDEAPDGSEVRVIYRPDNQRDPETVMTFRWIPETQEVLREYLGESESISKNYFGVHIMDLMFQYFSNVNEEIGRRKEGSALDEYDRKQITAAKVMISAKKDDTSKVLTQFVNMRNLGWATTGTVIKEGSELIIPNSLLIRALAVVNVFGIDGESKIVLEAESRYGKSWQVALTYDLVEEKPVMTQLLVEYPVGTVVMNQAVFQPAQKGFDLLSFDESGRYDYDDDEGIDDLVSFDDEEGVTMRVKSMEIGGAALYVRP